MHLFRLRSERIDIDPVTVKSYDPKTGKVIGYIYDDKGRMGGRFIPKCDVCGAPKMYKQYFFGDIEIYASKGHILYVDNLYKVYRENRTNRPVKIEEASVMLLAILNKNGVNAKVGYTDKELFVYFDKGNKIMDSRGWEGVDSLEISGGINGIALDKYMGYKIVSRYIGRLS